MKSSHFGALKRRTALFAAVATIGMLPSVPARGDDPVQRATKNLNNTVNGALNKISDKVNTLGGLLGPHRKKTPPHDFGDVPVGTSEDVQILSIAHNVGGGPAGGYILMVDSTEITGSDKNDFQIIQSDDHIPHKDGDQSIITIRFSPSKKGTEKAKLEEHVHSMTGGNAWSVPLELVGNGISLPVYIFIEGAQGVGSDPNSAPVRNYLNKQAVNYDLIGGNGTSNVKYAPHNDIATIEDYIQTLPKDTEVYLIGHSWGGFAATQIAADGARKIDELITIDPVDKNFDSSSPADRNRPPAMTDRPTLFANARANVKQWIDVDATLDDSSANSAQWDTLSTLLGRTYVGGSDWVANTGGDWGLEPQSYATSFVTNNTAHHSQFAAMFAQTQIKIVQQSQSRLSPQPGSLPPPGP